MVDVASGEKVGWSPASLLFLPCTALLEVDLATLWLSAKPAGVIAASPTSATGNKKQNPVSSSSEICVYQEHEVGRVDLNRNGSRWIQVQHWELYPTRPTRIDVCRLTRHWLKPRGRAGSRWAVPRFALWKVTTLTCCTTKPCAPLPVSCYIHHMM